MTNKKIKIGIAGGAGYTGGELIRLLINHPNVEISFIHSTSQSGKPITISHSDLIGDTDLCFTDTVTEVDAIFLCLGHGISREFLLNNKFKNDTRVIDLGNDFRLDGNFEGREFIYGLPEINMQSIKKSKSVANPGCFATAIQLALLPLAKNNQLKSDVHINAVTGSTGAGRSLTETSQFSWREGNISIYKAFNHQHLGEINKTLQHLGSVPELNFIPVRGNFTRGIFASLYTNCDLTQDEVSKLYNDYYKEHTFTHVTDREICLKDAVNTNKCLINVKKHGNKLLITSVIDNLLKGASGQAVQNMNLMFGFDERTGLNLKPAGF